MISLAPQWQEALPDTLFLAPHAPQRRGTMGAGYQWWGLSGFAPSALAAGAASAAPAIDAFIDRKLAQYELTDADLALVGFSQGTMMALHVALRRPRTVAAVVGYRSEEHTSELQSLMRISYAVFCLKKKKKER